MTALVHLEPLATPFAPADDQVTVATPSCCCCCCCCLVTITTATSAAAAEANLVARDNGGHRVLATILGLAAVPAGLLVLFALGEAGGNVSIPMSLVVTAALVLLSLSVAGAPANRSVPYTAVLLALLCAAMIAELFAALLTLFLIELLAPLGIWAGIAIARSRADRGAVAARAATLSAGPSHRHLLPPPRPIDLELAPPDTPPEPTDAVTDNDDDPAEPPPIP